MLLLGICPCNDNSFDSIIKAYKLELSPLERISINYNAEFFVAYQLHVTYFLLSSIHKKKESHISRGRKDC